MLRLLALLQEFVESKVQTMLVHLLYESGHASSLHQRSLAARDAFAYSLLWTTGLRGINAREVCCSDFWLPATEACPSQPALSSLYPVFTLSIGSKVELVPQRLKTSISANAASVQLFVQPVMLTDPLQWLHILLHCSQEAGTPISNILLRPETRDKAGFQEKFLQNPSLHGRLTKLLKQLQLYEGESLHSFRRGVAQQMQAAGVPSADILQQLLIKTPKVLHSCYLPAGRHDSGVKRVRHA